MTDEELKKKCTERAKIFQQAMESCKSSSPMDCIEWFADRIAELEKENAELKKKWLQATDEGTSWVHRKSLEIENSELKELIKNIIRVTWGEGWNYSLDWKVKAEQFLKDNA